MRTYWNKEPKSRKEDEYGQKSSWLRLFTPLSNPDSNDQDIVAFAEFIIEVAKWAVPKSCPYIKIPAIHW